MLGSVRTRGAGAWRGRCVVPLLVAAVLAVGLAATLFTAAALHADQQESAARVMDQRTSVARAAVIGETVRYLDLLHVVAAGLGTDARLTAADFAAAVAPLDTTDLHGAMSVGFVVATPTAGVAATQAFWRARGATGLTLTPRGEYAEHMFSIFRRSLNQDESAPPGGDAAPSVEATTALAEARRTGRPTVSDTYVLLRDRTLPKSEQQLSFVFAAPVHGTVEQPGGPAFRGWVTLGVRGQDFLGSVLAATSQGLLDGELYATNGDGARVRVAGYDAPGHRNLTREATFPVADRNWTLVTGADSAHLPGARGSMPAIVLVGGISITLMLACLVWILATGRSRAEGRVLVATAELRAAEAESRRQTSLLSAIMDSLGDGVSVIDESGAFLLFNPAATALLGVGAEDVAGPNEWQAHYGLFRPDGHTPLPVDEMPPVRALRGESTRDFEIIVRNDQRPDGILISVDCRPLDAAVAGRAGAVSVFRDITDLRRYETDLAVFAGVVAHDLKAPLAVIRGHCETAADELADASESPEVSAARAALDRIANAVDRMATLIDTLLAYTTSRDAPLKLATVPLGPLVADVIAHRTEHPRPGALPLDVYLGPLPDVEADPAMLRHVIDNLIGNALKYVQAGRGPRIDVTAAPGPSGWTRIEIADRGIGIPDEDKPNIFETFHRAQTAIGYAGTGLGLAICHRVVERHGGTIGVADNPGGGTRFHFTLPLAATGTPDPGEDLDRALAERAAVAESAQLPITPAAGAVAPPHKPGADRVGTA